MPHHSRSTIQYLHLYLYLCRYLNLYKYLDGGATSLVQDTDDMRERVVSAAALPGRFEPQEAIVLIAVGASAISTITNTLVPYSYFSYTANRPDVQAPKWVIKKTLTARTPIHRNHTRSRGPNRNHDYYYSNATCLGT